MQKEFSDSVKDWVAADNMVRLYLDKLKELRSERNELAEHILGYADQNNLGNAIIEISDGRLKFNDTKITSPLTFKFIKKCLNDCISDPSDVEKIMDYIKEKRDFRYIKDIKRQYSKILKPLWSYLYYVYKTTAKKSPKSYI